MCRDALDEFEQYDREQTEALERLPRCSVCEEPIQGDVLFEIHGELYCEDCIDDCRKYVDEYIND